MAICPSLFYQLDELCRQNSNRFVPSCLYLPIPPSSSHNPRPFLILYVGVISDFAKNKFDIPRSYCLVLVSLTCCISQIIAVRVDHIADLWVASSVLGLGYGAVFSLLPTVCLEWFGMRKSLTNENEHELIDTYHFLQLTFRRTGVTYQCHL